ncbi:predicted protein [Uncinocarpus reesii 1704]|uniref:Uncharacterized protein n=1 Tax=Uncinocarpus reesii (strain UAMH 1704) TaxID=336963 RepID=C4JM35_UNCRE|nr:uncharacterized protein UREG_03893 [Uncinocarpus reesii 1704]EEP79047.1 predicted protein [Uncinocarpus reesii 1704]
MASVAACAFTRMLEWLPKTTRNCLFLQAFPSPGFWDGFFQALPQIIAHTALTESAPVAAQADSNSEIPAFITEPCEPSSVRLPILHNFALRPPVARCTKVPAGIRLESATNRERGLGTPYMHRNSLNRATPERAGFDVDSYTIYNASRNALVSRARARRNSNRRFLGASRSGKPTFCPEQQARGRIDHSAGGLDHVSPAVPAVASGYPGLKHNEPNRDALPSRYPRSEREPRGALDTNEGTVLDANLQFNLAVGNSRWFQAVGTASNTATRARKGFHVRDLVLRIKRLPWSATFSLVLDRLLVCDLKEGTGAWTG